MKATDHTLRDQLRITDLEISKRKALLHISEEECDLVRGIREQIADSVDSIVETFYEELVSFDENANLIGDAESLARLKQHLRAYILSLFDGQYDGEYVQTRLRIGLVHKRIGVSPKLYLSAFMHLMHLLEDRIAEPSAEKQDDTLSHRRLHALQRIMFFDLALVFDTYIQGLMDELNRSRMEVEEYAESLEEVISERTRQLRELARKDGLTGLLNQRSLFEELRREISRSQRRARVFSLLYLDVDNFKQLNDTKGHKYGDRILMRLSDAVVEAVRPEDTPARYGGDEFCVILPDANASNGTLIARRIMDAFDARASEHDDEHDIRLSIGIAEFDPQKGISADMLLKMADEAMYQSKRHETHAVTVHGSPTVEHPKEH